LNTLLDKLYALRQDCEAAMLDYTGGASMCQIHKDGRVTGGLKYQEGRLVVLGAIIRQVKELPPAIPPDSLAAILTAEAAHWEADLARYRAAERPAIPWVAYSQGGVDTIGEIRRALLDGGTPS
jgi:hypothetical protein